MGGNAFKQNGYESKRMDLETFNQVKKEIYDFLTSLGIEYLDIVSVKDKTSFGDLDVLVVEKGDGVLEKIFSNIHQLGLTEEFFVKSGFCSSMLYKKLYQVDFIKTHDSYKEYHQKYLSHNDLGNLIGRCVKESHYKHGHDGLYYTYYDGTRIKKDFLISTDYREVLNLLGLSVEKFDEGFENVDDMFEYITNNKYFKPSFYQFENLNNRNRVRDAKRKNYNLFLEYVNKLNVDESQVPKLPSYKERYPEIIPLVEAFHAETTKINHLKKKFNGSIVMAITGLKDKELGDFIYNFKAIYSNEYLLGCDDATIEKHIRDFYSKT